MLLQIILHYLILIHAFVNQNFVVGTTGGVCRFYDQSGT